MFDKTNEPNVVKLLDGYIQIHGVPRNFRLDKARCSIGNKIESLCKHIIINIVTAPANDHIAIELLERLIQTVKHRLSCMKLANRTNKITIKEAIKSSVSITYMKSKDYKCKTIPSRFWEESKHAT